MATSKKDDRVKAKREKLKALGNGFGSDEPTIEPMDYVASLTRALNYYNVAHDNKDKRKWFMAYVGKKAKDFDGLDDNDFRSIGTMVRLKLRDQPLQDKELSYIEDTIKLLRQQAAHDRAKQAAKEQKAEAPKPKPSIQDRVAEAASQHIAEFCFMFDEFFTKDVEPNFDAYLKANNVSAVVAKQIPPAFVTLWNEMQELIEGKDKQLNEAYAHLKKTKVKKVCKFIEELEAVCAQRAVDAKAVRKPRARKEKPPSVVAKGVKFLKEVPELGLTSEKPEKIVGASEVVVYNAKYKKLQVYRAGEGAALSVKGTTIVGYEVATSSSKTIRKPDTLKDMAKMTKRSFATAFKAIKSKDSAVNGRVNEHCLIIRVY